MDIKTFKIEFKSDLFEVDSKEDLIDNFKKVINFPSESQYKLMIEKNSNFSSEFKNIEKRILENFSKYILDNFELHYLKIANDFFAESEKYNKTMNKNQVEWSNEVLKFFEEVNQDLEINNYNDLSNLSLTLAISNNMIVKSKKYENSSFIYESFSQIESRLARKGLLSKNSEKYDSFEEYIEFEYSKEYEYPVYVD